MFIFYDSRKSGEIRIMTIRHSPLVAEQLGPRDYYAPRLLGA